MAWSPGMGSLSEYCFPFLILYLNKGIGELKTYRQEEPGWPGNFSFLSEEELK